MSKTRLFLVGDPPSTSDVGKFCLRLRGSSYSPTPIFIDSSLNTSALNKINVERLSSKCVVACNIVNNVNLFSNIVSARLLAKKLSAPVTYIVHDALIEYPAHIAAMFLDNNQDFKRKYENVGHMVDLFIDECIPTHLLGQFKHGYSYEDRGRFLLSLALKDAYNVFCHSQFSKEIIEKSLAAHKDPRRMTIKALPLAYHALQYVEHHKESNHTTSDEFTIGLYGMFFNTAKNIDLLVDILSQLEAIGNRCNVWLSGRADNDMVDNLCKRLSFLSGSFIYHGFVDEQDLDHLISESDFIWAYRNPTHGESSGTVLRALANGTCPIVCDIGSYSEIPSSLVLAVSPSSTAGEIANLIRDDSINSLEQHRLRITYVREVHSPSLYVDTVISACSSSLSEPIPVNSNGCCGSTSQGLLSEGYLLPSLVSYSPITELDIKEVEKLQYSKDLLHHTYISELHIGFGEVFVDLYSVACSQASLLSSKHKNPHPFRTRFDYIYFVLKEVILDGCQCPSFACNIIAVPSNVNKCSIALDVGVHINSVVDAIRDYCTWHRESDRQTQLLETLINLGGLELLPPVWMLSYSGVGIPWSIDDCWAAAIIYYDHVEAACHQYLGVDNDRWIHVLARSRDVVTSVICSRLTRGKHVH